MKIINLDKFKTHKKISLDGKAYEVRGMTVEQFLNAGEPDVDGKSAMDQLRELVAYIVNAGFTNIPEKTLKKQEPEILNLIIRISQGYEPDDEEDEAEADGGEGKSE